MARRRPLDEPKGLPLLDGYKACGWSVDGEQCRYPATISKSALADATSLFFCSKHFSCEDAVAGADIVHASRDYVHRKVHDDALVSREAAAFCETRGLHTVEQLRSFCRAGVRKRPPPSDAWAYAAKARMERGESVPLRLAEMALDVLQHSRPVVDPAAGEAPLPVAEETEPSNVRQAGSGETTPAAGAADHSSTPSRGDPAFSAEPQF